MPLFSILKKKELPLPPPPEPPMKFTGDFEPIRANDEEHHEELPSMLPALPAPEQLSFEQEQAPTPDAWKPLTAPNPIQSAKEEEVVFDKTIARPAPPKRPAEVVRSVPANAFVAVEDYKRIITDTNTIRAKLMDAENYVKRLNDLKVEEERSLERWRTQLEDVEKKLTYVDQLIEKAQR